MQLVAEPLTAAAFADYGEVIDLRAARQICINDGLTTRFHDLCTVDVGDARPLVSIFRTEPLPLPHRVQMLERHPLGSQAFLPLDELPFLVLVAADASPPRARDLRLFVTDGKQGVNLYRNTWHHYQIVLHRRRDFVVVDRGGADNLEEREVEGEVWVGMP